jgi:hypothetical protein
MKNILIVLLLPFILNIYLKADISHYQERLSPASKAMITCKNNNKTYIEKKSNYFYTSTSRRFRSFEKAVKYACRINKNNGKLQKNAVVCTNEKSVNYLLGSKKNYNEILKGLAVNSFYKDCFLSMISADVNVCRHQHKKNLIKNYYVIYVNKNKMRYVPIEFVKSLNKTKKHKYKKKRKKKSKAKNSKISYKKYKKKRKKKSKTRSSKILHNKYKKKSAKKIPAYSVAKDEKVNTNTNTNTNAMMQEDTPSYIKVYRCIALSLDDVFIGQHLDKDMSKQMALDNCEEYKKDTKTCLLKNCIILRHDLN